MGRGAHAEPRVLRRTHGVLFLENLARRIPANELVIGPAAQDLCSVFLAAPRLPLVEDFERSFLVVRLEQAATDLQNGRVDALISDKFVVVDWLNKAGKDCCRLLGDVPGGTRLAGRRPRHDGLIAVRLGPDIAVTGPRHARRWDGERGHQSFWLTHA